MDIISMNCENTKTSDPLRLLLKKTVTEKSVINMLLNHILA